MKTKKLNLKRDILFEKYNKQIADKLFIDFSFTKKIDKAKKKLYGLCGDIKADEMYESNNRNIFHLLIKGKNTTITIDKSCLLYTSDAADE